MLSAVRHVLISETLRCEQRRSSEWVKYGVGWLSGLKSAGEGEAGRLRGSRRGRSFERSLGSFSVEVTFEQRRRGRAGAGGRGCGERVPGWGHSSGKAEGLGGAPTLLSVRTGQDGASEETPIPPVSP